jgi:excisionase family DNA binding protein
MTVQADASEFVSITDAAERLAVSRSTIYQLVKAGQLDLRRLGPKLSRITRASLDQLIAKMPPVDLAS